MAAIRTLTYPSRHDGLTVSALIVAPDGPPRALVQFAHGMCEHKRRYVPVMEFLAGQGYACAINDHRGHGESVRASKDLGYFYQDGANGLIADMYQLTELFRGEYPGKKLFLLGHSMGSLAVRAYCARYDREIDGLMVCGSPGENLAAGAGVALVRLLSAFRGDRSFSPLMQRLTTGGYGRRFEGTEGSGSWLSVDPANAAAYDADPLCGFPFTLNGYLALLNLMRMAYDRNARAKNPELPVWFLSGAEDACAPDAKGFNAAMQNMRGRGYGNVDGTAYPGMRHEILNETDRMRVWQDVLDHLNRWTEG